MTSSSLDLKKKPLEDTCCFIETFNDDGSDVSSSHARYLQDLGAEITDHISEKVTHYICSNVSPTKMAAARLLKIHILSPLWIEQCRQLGAKAREADFEYNLDLMKIINEFVRGRFNDSSLTNSSKELKPLASIPLPSFKEFILPVDTHVLKRRRSERISDLHDSDEEDDDDDSESGHESERKLTNSSSRDRSSTTEKLKKVRLKEAMELTRTKSLPVVYVEEPYEETWKRFEANLATDLVLDGNGPGQHKHPFTVLSRGKRRNQLNSSSHSLPPSSSKKERRKSVRHDDSSVFSNLSDSEEDNIENDSNSGSFSYFKSIPAKQPKSATRAKKQSTPKQTEHSSVTSNSRSEVVIPKGKIIIALTGFRKRNGEYANAEQAILSLVETIKAKKRPITTPNKQQLPSSSSKNSLKSLPSLIHPFETDVDIFPDTSNYEARISFVVVSQKNQSRTLRILFALAQGIPILDEEWIHASVKKEQWLNPLEFIYPRYRSLYNHLLTPSSFVQSSSSWTLLPRGMFKNRVFCVLRSTMPDTGILCQLIKKAGGTVTRDILTTEKLSYLVCGDLDDMKEWMVTKKNRYAKSPEYAMLDTYVHLKHPQIVTSKFIFNILEEQSLRYALKKVGESITFLDFDPMVEEIPTLIRRRKEGGYRPIRTIRYENLDSDTDDVGHDYDGGVSKDPRKKKVILEGEREEQEVEEESKEHENSSRKRKGEKDGQINQSAVKKVKTVDVSSPSGDTTAVMVETPLSAEKREVDELCDDDFVINLEPPNENFIQEMLHRYCKKDNPEELLPLQHFTDPYVDYMDGIKRKEEKERLKNLAANPPKPSHPSPPPPKKSEVTVATDNDRLSSINNPPITDKSLVSPSNIRHTLDGNGMQSPSLFTRAVSVVRSLWNAGSTMSPTFSEHQQLQGEIESSGMNIRNAHHSNGFDTNSVVPEGRNNSSAPFTSPKTASSRRPSITQEMVLNSPPVSFLEPTSATITSTLTSNTPAIVSPAHNRTVISFPEKESYSSVMQIEKVEHFKEYKRGEDEISVPSAKQAADSLVLLSTGLSSSIPTPTQQSPEKSSFLSSPKHASVSMVMFPPESTYKEIVSTTQTTVTSEIVSSDKKEEYNKLMKNLMKTVAEQEGKEKRGRTLSQQSDDMTTTTTPTPLRAKRNIKQNSLLSSDYDLSSF